MVKRFLISLTFAMITDAAAARTENECWAKWNTVAVKADEQPKTRSLGPKPDKVQAMVEALKPRSRDDEKWLAFRSKCLAE
jgi:hypothetical protein